MAEALAQLLSGWGLPPAIVSGFTDDDWTVESLKFISEEAVRKLIPKEGPRTLFNHHWNNFKNSDKRTERPSASGDDDDDNGNANIVNPRAKRRKLDNSQLQLLLSVEEGLHGTLKKSLPGLMVLGHFKAHEALDDHTRDLLCAQVLFKELENDYNKKIDRARFESLANDIVALFPSETKETWFDVIKKGNATAVQGRLRFKYYAIRRGLIKSLLIPNRNLDDSREAVDSDSEQQEEDSDDPSLVWLLENQSPWDEVEVKWEETRRRRLRVLQKCPQVFEYIEKFPSLKQPAGWQLIASDGVNEEPNLDLDLATLWVPYSKFLLTLIRQDQPDFLKGQQFKSLSSDQQFVYIFKELPSLFKVRTLPKSVNAQRKEKCWRPSRCEIVDGVCLHVEEIAEIQERVDAKKNVLRKFKFTLQPLPVFLGPLGNIRQSFIVLDGMRWEVPSPFDAVSGCFKLAFGLGTNYPVEARHIWLFLQKTLYNISTKQDFHKDRLSTLLFKMKCPYCPKCPLLLEDYRKHHKNHHSLKPFVCFQACGRKYTTWNSFMKHYKNCKVSSVAGCSSQVSNNSQAPAAVNNIFNSNEPNSSCVGDYSFHDSQLNDSQNFHFILHNEADKFVSKLYGKAKLPRQYVQDIIADVTSFLQNGVIAALKTSLVPHITNEQSYILNSILDSVRDSVSHLCSEYKRFKYFTSSGEYIPPISYEIGEIDVAEGDKLKKQKVYGQTVPIDLTLKQFLEVPNALNEIVQYIESLEHIDVMQNFVQSQLWQRKKARFSDTDIVLPLYSYHDECQCNNPLGSHVLKLGCAYVEIACLPPECQSSIHNIFVSLVFNSEYRCFSDEKAFGPLIAKLKFLEEVGIFVETPEGPKHVYFVCGLLLGDNLGINSVGGFAEGFTANFFCRFCKSPREVTKSQTIEDESTLRTKDNYETDLDVNNVSLTGVKTNSVFNKVPSFHITDNFCVDVFHDLCEGVLHYVTIKVLGHCVSNQYFSMDVLNHRIEMFKYGPTDSNRIPILSNEFSKKDKLKMSGSETLLFVKLLGIIIGDKVPHTDEYWKLYLKLRCLMDIALCKSLSPRQGHALRVLVDEFNSMYVAVTGDSLKPKFHHLVHYARVFEESGPLALTSTKTFERKHRSLLIPAHATESRTNIAKTVTIQHQLNMSHRLKYLPSIIPPLEFGPTCEVFLSDFRNHDFVNKLPDGFDISFSSSCLAANWVEFKGTTYKPGMVLSLAVDECGGPVFGLIEAILVFEQSFTFIFSYLVNVGLDEHVYAFEIELSSQLSCILPSDVFDPLPLSIHHSIHSKKYVSPSISS
ncbi:Oocyte zinc finger protein [Frankliniella fusca]|uniref:Oocyte zinc finger protein n=1 Tax=Frankliniella fusca TaxID=407009 RepID=A0AAE1HJH2_9NEOP|nr:Oocyte zinc finger protein [Frankliniella fusca]